MNIYFMVCFNKYYPSVLFVDIWDLSLETLFFSALL